MMSLVSVAKAVHVQTLSARDEADVAVSMFFSLQ